MSALFSLNNKFNSVKPVFLIKNVLLSCSSGAVMAASREAVTPGGVEPCRRAEQSPDLNPTKGHK